MKRWLQLVLCVLEAAIVLVAIYFEPSYRMRGQLWGEAFYDGRPTSYWRSELERWSVQRHVMRRHPLEWCGSMPRPSLTIYWRELTWFEKQWERWTPAKETEALPNLRAADERFGGPHILRDEAGAPVLRELLDDRSANVRLLAQIGLGMNPDIPGDDE